MKNNTLVRFGTVGIVNTALDFGLLFLFQRLGMPIAAANILSTSIAFGFSFLANKKYTFRSHGTNLRREIILFTVVTLFGLWVLQTVVIYLTYPTGASLLRNDDLGLLVAKSIATVVSLIWNYLLYSRVVFKKV